MSQPTFPRRHERTIAATKLSALVAVTAMASAVGILFFVVGLFQAVHG